MKEIKIKTPMERLSSILDYTGILTWITTPFVLVSCLEHLAYFLTFLITWIPAGCFFALSGYILKIEQRRKIMTCYKDMTFCKAESCKHFKYCRSAYTEEVKIGAEKWWGSKEAPVAFYTSVPDCYEKGEEKNG